MPYRCLKFELRQRVMFPYVCLYAVLMLLSTWWLGCKLLRMEECARNCVGNQAKPAHNAIALASSRQQRADTRSPSGFLQSVPAAQMQTRPSTELFAANEFPHKISANEE